MDDFNLSEVISEAKRRHALKIARLENAEAILDELVVQFADADSRWSIKVRTQANRGLAAVVNLLELLNETRL